MSTLADTTSGRHPVNTGHLVMGLAFLGLCGVWLAVQSGAVSTDDVSWLLPLPWVFAGTAGLIALAFAGRRSGRRQEEAAPAYVEPVPFSGTDTEISTDTQEIR